MTHPLVLMGLAIWTTLSVAATWTLIGRIESNPDSSRDDLVRRVARNSAIPIASQLLIRGIDLAVAVVLLRLLGPEGNGRYAIAVIIWLYVKTISDFGLSLLGTRDVARDPGSAGRVVGVTTLMRLVILAIAAAPVGVYVAAGLTSGAIAEESAMAIVLLYLSVIPSSFSEAINSALNGIERMDVAAWLNIGANLARAPLVLALASTPLEVVGVALAALFTAVLSAGMYLRVFQRLIGGTIVWSLSRAEARFLARESWPLLVNALLVNLFFRVDVFLVQAFRGDAALGVYDAAYKLINLVTIIPAYITLAIFPTMAARAGDRAALARTQSMASYVLVWVAWGIVVGISATADVAIHILAGSAYLPEAATLLRILIWFAPLSFLNGVFQYVLVAANQQQRIVPAFVSAVIFNLLANLVFVPLYGARAAAINTVVTEIVILLGFVVVTRHGPLKVLEPGVVERLWRPTLAGLISALAVLAVALRYHEAAAAAVGVVLFVGLSLTFRVISADERELFRRAVRRERVVSA